MKRGKKKRAGIVILAAVIVLVGAGIFFGSLTHHFQLQKPDILK